MDPRAVHLVTLPKANLVVRPEATLEATQVTPLAVAEATRRPRRRVIRRL